MGRLRSELPIEKVYVVLDEVAIACTGYSIGDEDYLGEFVLVDGLLAKLEDAGDEGLDLVVAGSVRIRLGVASKESVLLSKGTFI